jgi:hypothetical protein
MVLDMQLFCYKIVLDVIFLLYSFVKLYCICLSVNN